MEEHRPNKLLDQVRDAIRLKHYSYRMEQAYVGWIKRYIHFHDVRHPSEMGAPEPVFDSANRKQAATYHR